MTMMRSRRLMCSLSARGSEPSTSEWRVVHHSKIAGGMSLVGHFGRSQSLSAAPPLRPTPHLYEDLTKLSAVARFANCQVRWTQLRPVQRPSAYSPRLDNRE